MKFQLATRLTEEYKKWLAQYESTQQPGDSVVMRLLHLSLTDQDRFRALLSMLGANGLGLIDSILVGGEELPEHSGTPGQTAKKRHFYFLDFLQSPGSGGGRFGFDYGSLSLGTRRVIRLLVSLVFDDSTVMLVEHPEDGIHTGLTRKLIVLMKRYCDTCQLVISSHSLVVFNTLLPEEVRLVTMTRGLTSLRALTPSEIKGAHDYISEQGPFSRFLENVQED